MLHKEENMNRKKICAYERMYFVVGFCARANQNAVSILFPFTY